MSRSRSRRRRGSRRRSRRSRRRSRGARSRSRKRKRSVRSKSKSSSSNPTARKMARPYFPYGVRFMEPTVIRVGNSVERLTPSVYMYGTLRSPKYVERKERKSAKARWGKKRILRGKYVKDKRTGRFRVDPEIRNPTAFLRREIAKQKFEIKANAVKRKWAFYPKTGRMRKTFVGLVNPYLRREDRYEDQKMLAMAMREGKSSSPLSVEVLPFAVPGGVRPILLRSVHGDAAELRKLGFNPTGMTDNDILLSLNALKKKNNKSTITKKKSPRK